MKTSTQPNRRVFAVVHRESLAKVLKRIAEMDKKHELPDNDLRISIESINHRDWKEWAATITYSFIPEGGPK